MENWQINLRNLKFIELSKNKKARNFFAKLGEINSAGKFLGKYLCCILLLFLVGFVRKLRFFPWHLQKQIFRLNISSENIQRFSF